ncbi:MAG TPA: DMT family transporter [Gammaproteobacteria bacterium]|nr:DMT family transporter [Gammaproteobacteria bacterium]
MIERSVRPLQGAALLALSALLFSSMGVLIREASATVNNENIVFFRNIVGVFFFMPLVLAKGIRPFKTQRLKSHLMRTSYGLAAMYCFFYAIANLPLADAMVFTYSAPVFTPIIAYFWLKEPLTKRMLGFSVLGLIGVILVAKPSDAIFGSLSLVGLAASVLAATAFVSIREMSNTEPAYRMVFYFALFGSLISAVPLLWAWQPLNNDQLILLCSAGLLAALAQIVMSRAYSLAPPGLIGPVAYLAIIFAGVFSFVLWDEVPDLTSIFGAVLIFAVSTLAVLWRKH